MNLKIKNLTKSFEGEIVLDDLTLEVDSIHAMAIIGSSGGGKTTLLRILAGLEKPDSGQVIVNGKEIIFEGKALHEYRKTVGMVFQTFNLFPHLNAEENITLPLEKVHHFSREKAQKKSAELLKKFRLAEHNTKRPAQLSGGQKQRVAIARALSIEPQFLLLDEPTSALDPSLTSDVIRTIETLRAENKDLILVTHE
ncbi:MAG: ATP-binding cassette domain-containing protein, partial [Atopostipes suicloacalis]|nr:ATP-binding cassette domain-containing protein [Atopostipes suicloacalis]